MADLAEETLERKGSPTVGDSANQCLEAFQECLIRASSVHPWEFSKVEDQVARFSTWASSIGVFAPGRASMDHRLRYAPEVQSVVMALLESLNYRIRTCSDVLDQLSKPASTVGHVLTEPLEQPLTDIGSEISRLNKISNTIRRAGKEAQTLKASDFQIKDDDGENVEPLLLHHFEHHIQDRFPEISESLRQRLARAMLLRRKRILHRRHRQGNTAIHMQKAVVKVSITLPAAQKTEQGKQKLKKVEGQVDTPTVAHSHIQSATTLAPNKFKLAASSPSVVSVSKTVALGNHETLIFPPAPGFASKQKYERLKGERIAYYRDAVARKEITPGDADLKLDHALSLDLQAIGEITCPYCLYALPAREMFEERKWHHHVKSDLDPYVCLFEDCDQTELLYNHTDEWFSHMREHTKFWRCPSHRELGSFPTREAYIAHLHQVHSSSLGDSQIRTLANRNSRKAVTLFVSCPLCGKEDCDIDGRLEDHVTGHLRSLALKSLPSYEEEIPGDMESILDGGTSQLQSRSTVRTLGTDEGRSELRSSDFWETWGYEIMEHRIAEVATTNFLGAPYFELNPNHQDSWVGSWEFEGLSYLESMVDSNDDPVLQSLRSRPKFTDEETDLVTLPSDSSVSLSDHSLDSKNQGVSGGKLEVQVMETRKRILGPDHPDTLTSMGNLASTYRNQGRWEEAEKLDVQVMETSKSKLGPDHPSTLTSMANLALTFWNQGRWEEAEKLFVQVMETRKTKLGVDHPSTLTSMANLASTLWNQGRWEEAEKLFVQVMETRKSKLGPDHPDTLTSMDNLALIYRNQGRWEEAEKLFVQVMETRKSKLGPDHPDTLTSIANLASTFWNQGRWEDAEKLEVQVMETHKRILGPDHSDTLTSMGNLASTYRNQGRWEEAEKLEVQVMETRKSKLGPDHPDTLTSMANLASTYSIQGRWEDAEKLEVQVMETRKRILGLDHPDTLTSMDNLALIYRNQGRWEEAEKLFVQVMETRKSKLGPDHPDTLTSMANLASTCSIQGRWEDAEKLEVQVMETRKSKLGPDHPDTLTSVGNLASTFRNQGRWKEAEKLGVQVMETRKSKLGPDHPDTLTSMGNLASTYRNQGRWEEAEELCASDEDSQEQAGAISSSPV